MKRHLFIATSLGAATATLTGCARATDALNESPIHNLLVSAEQLDHAVIGTHGMARVYPDSAVDANFRTNGFDTPADSAYRNMFRGQFASYKLVVGGEVERPQVLSLAQLHAMKQLAQVTRHDCVEGWSAIGKFGGVPLGHVLRLAQPKATARYVVFHCFDRSPDNDPYYESLDLKEAAHPQTILALDLNDKPIDADHGAPVRLKVPTQLGYKSAKWVSRIEVVAGFKHIYGGSGGYWEDNGYEWYAGI